MTKKELMKNGEDLMNRVIPDFRHFISDTLVISHVNVSTKKYVFEETVSLREANSLCALYIIREHARDRERDSISDSLTIKVMWFDWHESLVYIVEFFPLMDNDAVAAKVKIFLDSAMESVLHTHRYRDRKILLKEAMTPPSDMAIKRNEDRLRLIKEKGVFKD